MSDPKSEPARLAYKVVSADLVETVPDNAGLLHWILASPILLFLAWTWVDLFSHYSPIPFYWLDLLIGVVIFAVVLVLPLGLGAYFLVSSVPRLFGHAGWDVQPLEPVRDSELHTVRYRYQSRRRVANSWGQTWARAAQGWVYLEIAVILIGAVAMIPIFFSVSDFGFGQP